MTKNTSLVLYKAIGFANTKVSKGLSWNLSINISYLLWPSSFIHKGNDNSVIYPDFLSVSIVKIGNN